jgi:glucosamine 6-phosphate synthetase-like amidotransferase/phosphosugar isomerase protein
LEEVSVAATKSFFHQVLNLIYYATLVAERKQSVDMNQVMEIRHNLLNAPKIAKMCIEIVEEPCEKLVKSIYQKESVYFVALRESLTCKRGSIED